MRVILVVNSKGGCGKTTLVTNLAGYYAAAGKKVALADFDPQGSSMDWLSARPEDRPPIHGVAAWENSLRVPKNIDYVIIDAPSGIQGRALADLVRRAGTIIIPVLPSPFDMRAAGRFVQTIVALKKVTAQQVKLATVANQVRERTLIAGELGSYLSALRLPNGKKLPCKTALRASQSYIRAAEHGLSIFEFAPYATQIDREQWRPLLRWLNSAHSVA